MLPLQRTYIPLVLTALSLPLPALAAEFLSGEAALISTSGPVEDDLYAAGQQVDIDEPVRDDVFVAGQTIAVRDEIGGDVFAAGQQVALTGTVQDDVLTAGESVRISGDVKGDVFAAGNQVFIDRGATIGGDVFAAAGEVIIEGTVQGSVRSAGQQTRLGGSASIGGDLLTFGGFPPTIADGARIAGAQTHAAAPAREERGTQELIGWWVRSTLGWFILAALLLYAFPRFAQRCADLTFTRGGAALGIGTVWLLLGVPIAVLVGALIIGWPAVVLVLFGTVADVIAALAVAILTGGMWLTRAFMKSAQPLRWQHALVGAVAMKLLLLVPIIGGLVVLVLVLLAIGVAWLVVWQTFGRNKQEQHA